MTELIKKDDIIGRGEVMELLGINKDRITRILLNYSDFPRPFRVIRGGSLWDLAEVAAWAQANPHRIKFIRSAETTPQAEPVVEIEVTPEPVTPVTPVERIVAQVKRRHPLDDQSRKSVLESIFGR